MGEAYYIIKRIVKRVPGYRDIVLPMVFKVKRPYEELRVRSDEGLFAKYSHVLLAWVFERRCLDERYLERFYTEEEFREVMRAMIDACYPGDHRDVSYRLFEAAVIGLLTFEEIMEARERVILINADPYMSRYTLKLMPGMATLAFDLEFYLHQDFFCIFKCFYKDCFICAPYDINRIDPSTVASLDEPEAMLIKYAVMRLMREKEAGSKKLAKFADVIDRVIEVCRYIFALWELMRR